MAPSEINYVNAHATSTPAGDLAEYRAIRAAIPGGHVRINGTKSMIGHLLGAAGAVEAIATVQAIRTGAGAVRNRDALLHAPFCLEVEPTLCLQFPPCSHALSVLGCCRPLAVLMTPSRHLSFVRASATAHAAHLAPRLHPPHAECGRPGGRCGHQRDRGRTKAAARRQRGAVQFVWLRRPQLVRAVPQL